MFDYLVVGAGFAGSVIAERLARVLDKRVLICDRRPHIGGNAYDHYDANGLLVHRYGPHLFHTNSRDVFDYLSHFTEWRPYENRVLASVDGQLLPIPINLDTVNRLYGLKLTSPQLEQFFAERAEPCQHVRTSEARTALRHVTPLLPNQFRRAFLSRLAYSVVYHTAFEPVRVSLTLPDVFLTANHYDGANTEALMGAERRDAIQELVGVVHRAYTAVHGRDVLRSDFEVRYINSANAQRLHEVTAYGGLSDFHLDETSDFKCIVYLTPTQRENGCFSYFEGASTVRTSHVLRALQGVVRFDMGLNTPEQVAHLPLELRGGSELGNYLDDDKHDALARARVDVVGDAGEGIIFDGFHTLHRGGKPTSGERTALVISTAGRLRKGVNKGRRLLLERLWM